MPGVNFRWHDGVGVIELDDSSTRNALNDEIVAHIRARLAEWAQDPQLRGLVFTGAHGVFSSGGSLDMIERRREETRQKGGREAIAAIMRENAKLVAELRAFPAPTVAAIDGACVGAAIAWACSCDVRIATERAKFITGYAKVGLSTDFGAARLLAEIVGRGRAASWLYTSSLVTAHEAQSGGLVSGLYAVEELLPNALALAASVNARAIVATRANLDDAQLGLDEALIREADRFAALL